MCGIIAYKGPRDAVSVAIDGLKTLEYRGYDSWGFACVSNDKKCFVEKHAGAIAEAIDFASKFKKLECHTIIAHTRWATHGGVNELNAHPHISNNGRYIVVQNGIVENFMELKQMLKKKGFVFKSETDTEIIANLIEYEARSLRLKDGDKNIKTCIRNAFKKLEGRNAIAVLDKTGGTITALRFGSPLVVGVGSEEYFIASDIPAFLPYTNKVMYLDDGQLAQITNDGIAFYNISNGLKINRRVITVDLKPEAAEKGKYAHFMIKEIMEQKETIRRAVNQENRVINHVIKLIKESKGTFFIGAGTAGRVCHYGEYIFSRIANRHINFVVASEFKNYLHFITNKSLIIAVSQSGETADVLEPLEAAKKIGAKIVSIVNVAQSSLDRKSDYTLLIKAGVERAVASTKATTAQMSVIALLAYAFADKISQGRQNLVDAASAISELLNPRYEIRIKKLANKIKNSRDIMIIGKGVNYPAALEAEIKLQETSYIHAQGFAGGELKHYALSLVSKGVPAIALTGGDELRAEIISNAKEIKSRGGYIIGIGPLNDPVFDVWLRVPSVSCELSAIVNLIPVQILAYHLALLRGCNPDKPRNLAKSVTVK